MLDVREPRAGLFDLTAINFGIKHQPNIHKTYPTKSLLLLPIQPLEVSRAKSFYRLPSVCMHSVVWFNLFNEVIFDISNSILRGLFLENGNWIKYCD